MKHALSRISSTFGARGINWCVRCYHCNANFILPGTFSAVAGGKLTPGPTALQSLQPCNMVPMYRQMLHQQSTLSCWQEPAVKLTARLGLSSPPQHPTHKGLGKASSILHATETQPHMLLLQPSSSHGGTHWDQGPSSPPRFPFLSASPFHSIYIPHLPSSLLLNSHVIITVYQLCFLTVTLLLHSPLSTCSSDPTQAAA